MASQHDLAAQQRNEALRARQRAQRATLPRVAAALERVTAAEEREVKLLTVAEAQRRLAAAKAELAKLIEQQKARPAGRRLGTVKAEQAAAGREIAAAVEAFGSMSTAAEALGLPLRTVRTYLGIARAADNGQQDPPTA
jgi:pantothenate synthetase